MKKIAIAVLVAAMLIAGLTSCGKEEENPGVITLDKQTNGAQETTTGEEVTTGKETAPNVGADEMEFTSCNDRIEIAKDLVNLRTNTILGDEYVRATATKGDQFDRVAKSEFWSKIKYGDGYCYVKNTLIRTVVTGFDTLPTPKTMYVIADGLNVRLDPDADSQAVGTLTKGDEVKVVATSDKTSWVRIEYDSGEYGKGEYYIKGKGNINEDKNAEYVPEKQAQG